jgi:NDP-sugar pyrophosphorylase family protein
MLPVAVLAGGLGTRLRSVTGDALPKVLVPVDGRPFVDYKLTGLAQAGVERVVMLVGHHGDAVRDHVGDGARFGLTVEWVEDGPIPLGTGGALAAARDRLGDACWITYGDTLLDVDLAAAETTFAASGCAALMTVLHNRDRYEPSNVVARDGLVVAYGKAPRPAGAEHIDYGMLAMRSDALVRRPGSAGEFDVGVVLAELIERRDLAAFEVTERFHDIGTPEALAETTAFLAAHPELRRASPRRGVSSPSPGGGLSPDRRR